MLPQSVPFRDQPKQDFLPTNSRPRGQISNKPTKVGPTFPCVAWDTVKAKQYDVIIHKYCITVSEIWAYFVGNSTSKCNFDFLQICLISSKRFIFIRLT